VVGPKALRPRGRNVGLTVWSEGNTQWIGRAMVCLAVLLFVVGTVPPAVSTSNQPRDPVADIGGPVQQQSFDADAVVMRVALQPDGSASWTVRYRLDISTENETAAFEDLRADITANTSAYISSFRTRIRGTVDEAANVTGREMRAENFSIQTRTDSLSESGFVTYRFTWHAFAAVDGDRLIAGDALAGLFLDEQTTLTMAWPQEYTRQSVRPDPTRTEDRSVSWEGRQTFAMDEPRLVVGPPPSTFPAWVPAVGLGILIIIIGGYLYRSRWDQEPQGTTASAPGETAEVSEATTGSGSEGGESGDDEPPPELLSNEERVLELLEQQGGRIKQQEVVRRLDWTEAKTSQVVTDMRESGDVEVFRIGRENVIKLPDVELSGENAESDEAADAADEGGDQ
jgi:uncharacterized membrane protein